MWQKSKTGDSAKPVEVEKSGDYVIVRKNFRFYNETDEESAHWEYEEWQMTKDQYDVYLNFEKQLEEQQNALIELADMIAGGI